MSVISKRFADELNDKRMRDAYLSAQTRTRLVNQIRTLRDQRGWSQGEFAARLGKPQSNVSRLENREYGNFNLKTLFELANAFDVGLVVEFVAYDEFLRRTHHLSSTALRVPGFSATALDDLSREPDGIAPEEIDVFVERLISQERSVRKPEIQPRSPESAVKPLLVVTGYRPAANLWTPHPTPDASFPAAPVQNISDASDALGEQNRVSMQPTRVPMTVIAPNVPLSKLQTQAGGPIFL